MKRGIRKEDTVIVIAGADRGSSGRVLDVDRKKNRVKVEGVNVRKIAVKRNQQNMEGGFVERECPVHISNVMLEENYEARKARKNSSGANA